MQTFAKQSDVWRDFFSTMVESSKKLKTSNLFSSFIVSSNRNRSALVRELLCARDLIFFTTDLQTKLHNNSARADHHVNISVQKLPQICT